MWACVGRDSAQIRLPVHGGPGVGGMLPVHQEVAGDGEKRGYPMSVGALPRLGMNNLMVSVEGTVEFLWEAEGE